MEAKNPFVVDEVQKKEYKINRLGFWCSAEISIFRDR
jgi:hypothetical protein